MGLEDEAAFVLQDGLKVRQRLEDDDLHLAMLMLKSMQPANKMQTGSEKVYLGRENMPTGCIIEGRSTTLS